MNYIITTTEGEALSHHGILGQKWGVTNGPPYPLDANDHSKNEIKEGYKRSIGGDRNEELYERNRKTERKEKKALKEEKQKEALIKSYMKSGMTREQAQTQAENYKKAMKRLAIIGASAVLAGGAIYAYSKLDKYGKDFIIKQGESIYRVASKDTKGLQDVFYATPDKADFDIYKAKWGEQKGFFGVGNGVFKAGKEFSAVKDIKIASNNSAKKIFNDLKKDPEFSKAIKDLEGSLKGNMAFIGLDKEVTKYENFNAIAPLMRDDKSSKAFVMFKETLQKMGYDGVIDYNDKYGVGLGTKAPIIFFGGNTNFALKNFEELNKDLIRKADNAANQYMVKKAFIETLPMTAIESGGGLLAAAGLQAATLNSLTKQSEEPINKEQSK